MKKRNLFLGLSTIILPVLTMATVACSKVEIGTPFPGSENATKDVAYSLRGQGSSSVLPVLSIMQDALSSKDFQYEGTGSGDGFKVGTNEIDGKDFGMTSSLKQPLPGSQANAWISNKTRTITFAIDAIGIALNLPSGLKASLGNDRPIVDGTVLGHLYDKDTSNDNVTWDELLINPAADNYSDRVIPQGRTGGKASSGTADGFFHKMPEVSGLSESQLDLNHVTLGPEHQTAESNASAKQALESNKNSLAYLSLGFALANESDNLSVAVIQIASGAQWVPSIPNVIDKHYGWTRPFNLIYSTVNQKALSFAQFVLTGPVQNLVQWLNFVPLTQLQIAQQANITEADSELVSDVTTDVLGLSV